MPDFTVAVSFSGREGTSDSQPAASAAHSTSRTTEGSVAGVFNFGLCRSNVAEGRGGRIEIPRVMRPPYPVAATVADALVRTSTERPA